MIVGASYTSVQQHSYLFLRASIKHQPFYLEISALRNESGVRFGKSLPWSFQHPKLLGVILAVPKGGRWWPFSSDRQWASRIFHWTGLWLICCYGNGKYITFFSTGFYCCVYCLWGCLYSAYGCNEVGCGLNVFE